MSLVQLSDVNIGMPMHLTDVKQSKFALSNPQLQNSDALFNFVRVIYPDLLTRVLILLVQEESWKKAEIYYVLNALPIKKVDDAAWQDGSVGTAPFLYIYTLDSYLIDFTL